MSYYFAPGIVTVVCPILFHEKLTIKQIVCFIMSTLGLVMITGIGDLGGENDFIGILFGLGAAAFYAVVILLNKVHQECRRDSQDFYAVSFGYCDLDSICYNNKWSDIGKA